MPNLYQMTDAYEEPVSAALPVEQPYLGVPADADGIRRVYINKPDEIVQPKPNEIITANRPEPRPEPGIFDNLGMAGVQDKSGKSESELLKKLFGLGGKERHQLWPEKIVREGLKAAGEVMSTDTLSQLGLRREDLTDIPAPSGPTKDSTWLGKILGAAPVAAQPGDDLIEKAQAISALAGSGGIAGTGAEAGVALGAGPSLRPALKYKEKLYKGKEGQQHMDVIPNELYPEFQKMAMSGEDISHYNFGFVNDKGQFLTRDKALEYAINTGLIDPQAGKYGALTSTLMADSSKPGTAIEAMAQAGKANLDNAWWHGSASGDLRGGSSGLHLGTKKAATQALEARIGIPADGKGWTGNREYGKTLLAGQDTLKKMDPKGYNLTGHNVNVPKEDYYPTEIKKYPDGTEMPMTVKPEVAPYKLKGSMTNTTNNPYDDFKANGYMRGQLKRGIAKNGYYYKNVGEDSGSISMTVPNGNHIEKILLADSSKEGAALQSNKPTFYSAVEHNLSAIPQSKMTGDQWLGTLANKPGVKGEELDWTGLKGFLEENKGKPVTKAQIEEHLANNKVELKEVTKDKTFKSEPEFGEPKINGETKYHSYQLPGGENYREMLLTLPNKPLPVDQFAKQLYDQWGKKGGGTEWEKLSAAERQPYLDNAQKNGYLNTGENNYKSSHWDEPNILAHVRMNDRNIDGKKSLHLEEIQSDWHQQGRDKGYRPEQEKQMANLVKQRDELQKEASTLAPSDARYKEIYKELPTIQTKINEIGSGGVGVPDAPFKKSWHELALKRMLREAAEKGYDRLSWTPGEAQAARYDLSKSVDKIAVPMVNPNGTRSVRIDAKNDTPFKLMINKDGKVDGMGSANQFSGKPLSDVVGKEMAEKIMKLEKPHEFSGEGLKIGGEGMKGFYDQIIPKALEKLGKEHGVKVKVANLKAAPKYETKNPLLNKKGKEIVSVYKDGTFMADMEKSEAAHYIKTKSVSDKPEIAFYIDIPQSLKDTAMHKGFPLFSNGYMLVPVQGNPFQQDQK